MGADVRLDRRDLRIALLLGAAAVIVYLPALTTWFLADDFLILARVQAAGGLRHPLAYFQAGFYDYYRPLAFLSQALDWNLWGLNASGFHFTNVCVHAASTMLVFVLGRRFMGVAGAAGAALLFGWHPANHEPVFWIAGRFDLLATFFVLLSLWLLCRDDPRSYVAGVACFTLALLSKESAVALPIMASAHDVFVRGRTWQATVKRLMPLLGLMAIDAVLRAEGAGLSPVDRNSRLAKLAMFVFALAALVWVAWRNGRSARAADRSGVNLATAALCVIGAGLLAIGAIAWPETSRHATILLNFVTYALFYLVTPVVFPAPPASFLEAASPVYWAVGLAAALAILLGLLLATRWLFAHASALFLLAFGAAALIPVSSMTGGTRYLYLASAATSLLAAYVWQSLPQPRRARTTAVLALVLAVSAGQILLAAREWRWASDLTRDGLALMAHDMAPCGTKDIILLTMPEGGRGVLTNFPSESLRASGQCAAKTFVALLRVVRDDATVEVTSRPGGMVELRVPHYVGNITASKDLSNFFAVPATSAAQIDTPIGRLETRPDGDAEVFRLQLNEGARQAALFYYSDGSLHAVR